MSNATKAKKIMEDHFHSGGVDSMSTADLIQIRDELAALWILIDGVEISSGMSQHAVKASLSDPIITMDNTWLYPSTFEQYYYSINFDSGLVKETDFVTLKTS